VYRFFGIAVLLHVKRHSSGRTTSKGEDHLVDRIIGARKTWLAPLIITVVIFAALFFLVGGTIDIPFLYRSTR
jgi:hypothetical protein